MAFQNETPFVYLLIQSISWFIPGRIKHRATEANGIMMISISVISPPAATAEPSPNP